uniref:Uncharacterized protein n=1 Tax=Felis catus TaxID=9685 RepID=A0ABI7VTU1_FELCA
RSISSPNKVTLPGSEDRLELGGLGALQADRSGIPKSSCVRVDGQPCLWSKRHCPGSEKLAQPLRKTAWSLLKILKIELPYDPAIPLRGVYRKETKSGSSRDLCAPMFTATSFTAAEIWKQPECSSTDERVEKIERRKFCHS